MIRQHASGSIGAKLYPGALALCAHFARAPLPAHAAVIEVGAGVCALPSISLAVAGARVIATDAGDMCALLGANVARAADAVSASGRGGALSALPLFWGSADDAAAVRVAARERAGWGRSHVPSFVIGADVVYHEPLIEPLLAALRALTDPPTTADESSGDWAAPTVILSYVQRFKRARRFFKSAARDFHVSVVACGQRAEAGAPALPPSSAPFSRVVDYAALTWALPVAQRTLAGVGAEGVHVPSLAPGDADFETHCRLLVAAAAECVAAAPAQGGGGFAHGAHAIDSDSGDEWEDAPGAARAFITNASCSAETAAGDGGALSVLKADAARAAEKLGVPFEEYAECYVYVMTRR